MHAISPNQLNSTYPQVMNDCLLHTDIQYRLTQSGTKRPSANEQQDWPLIFQLSLINSNLLFLNGCGLGYEK